jgi:hypothetical protein
MILGTMQAAEFPAPGVIASAARGIGQVALIMLLTVSICQRRV